VRGRGEENPPEFPACWNCQAELPAMPTPPTHPEAPPVAPRRAPSDSACRKRLVFELAAVLVFVWGGFLRSGALNALGSRPPMGLGQALFALLDGAGILALLVYLAWLDGDWRRFFKLRRRSLLRSAAAEPHTCVDSGG
jgi:hypothetical protein